MPPNLISDFTGADENPLSEGGNWGSPIDSSLPTNVLQKIGNSASGATVGDCYSYWTPGDFGPDVEAYITFSTWANGGGILLRVQEEGGAGTWDGYRIRFSPPSTPQISRVDNAVITNLTLTGSVTATWASGDKLGASCQGSVIRIWRFPSAGSAWALHGTANDATYPNDGKIGVYCNSTTIRADDFFAGQFEYFFRGVPLQMPRDPAEFPQRHFGPF